MLQICALHRPPPDRTPAAQNGGNARVYRDER
jgi:hypothetical protein